MSLYTSRNHNAVEQIDSSSSKTLGKFEDKRLSIMALARSATLQAKKYDL
jgi:hypothetical protein